MCYQEAQIHSVDALRLVCFNFGSSPDVVTHVDQYKRKKWLLYHLRDAGLKDDQLFLMYCCYVRSVIEYCSPVYNSLLSKSQEQQLERLQRHAIQHPGRGDHGGEKHRDAGGEEEEKDGQVHLQSRGQSSFRELVVPNV